MPGTSGKENSFNKCTWNRPGAQSLMSKEMAKVMVWIGRSVKFTLNLVTRLITNPVTLPLCHRHVHRATRSKAEHFYKDFQTKLPQRKRPRTDRHLIVLTEEQDILANWKKNTTSVLRLNINIRHRTNSQVIMVKPQTSLFPATNCHVRFYFWVHTTIPLQSPFKRDRCPRTSHEGIEG
jgi:hypothetical protein